MFMDEKSLQAGNAAWAKMQAKLRGARRVLAVLSPRYQESWWCVKRTSTSPMLFAGQAYYEAFVGRHCLTDLDVPHAFNGQQPLLWCFVLFNHCVTGQA